MPTSNKLVNCLFCVSRLRLLDIDYLNCKHPVYIHVTFWDLSFSVTVNHW